MKVPEKKSENGRRPVDSDHREHEVPVARVSKPHGIRGEIKVQPYYDGARDFSRYPDIVLQDSVTGQSRVFRIGKARNQGEFVLLVLEGINDRDAAEQYRGFVVLVKKEYLPDLPEGRYYWHELDGLKVVTQEGLELGTISNVMPSGAHDILVITGAGREFLIPLVKEFIVAKHDASRILVVAPAPGLLEINE